VPVWYIMDEFGSRFSHSTQPNTCFTCLYYAPRNITYSLFWPTTHIANSGLLSLRMSALTH
jgi:hypothetical protein